MQNEPWSFVDKLELYKMYIREGAKWTKFAEYFNSTPESVRKIVARTKWEKLFISNGTSVVDVVKEAKSEKSFLGTTLSEDCDEPMTLEDMIDEQKNKILENNEKRKLNEQIKNLAQENLIYEKIVAAIERVPNISPAEIKYAANTKSERPLSPQEAVLLIGDVHAGLAVLPEELGGLGNYNMDILKNRMTNLTHSVVKISNLHRLQHPLETINIIALGDIVHGGRECGAWGSLHTEQNVMDQVFESIACLRNTILALRQNYKKVRFFGIGGNHGRTNKPGVEKHFVNWDYLIYKWLESSLELQDGIEFNIPKSTFCIAEIMNQKILAIHGDQAKGWLGIPFYGLSRIESKYKNILDGSKSMEKLNKLMEEKKIDKNNSEEVAKFVYNYVRNFQLLICGHFHSAANLETNGGGRIIINSSFVGGDDYSVTELISASIPSQKFFGINHEGITWNYDIELDRK